MESLWNKSSRKEYQYVIVRLMSFKDKKEYRKDQVFSRKQLLKVTDGNVLDFLRWSTFGDLSPVTSESKILLRSATLYFYKKAIFAQKTTQAYNARFVDDWCREPGVYCLCMKN